MDNQFLVTEEEIASRASDASSNLIRQPEAHRPHVDNESSLASTGMQCDEKNRQHVEVGEMR